MHQSLPIMDFEAGTYNTTHTKEMQNTSIVRTELTSFMQSDPVQFTGS